VTAPAGAIAKKPGDLSHEQAAGLPVAGMTARQALFDRSRARAEAVASRSLEAWTPTASRSACSAA
jgi:NADPH:quinone reductase-like Zn-dependent oxidoreductase